MRINDSAGRHMHELSTPGATDFVAREPRASVANQFTERRAARSSRLALARFDENSRFNAVRSIRPDQRRAKTSSSVGFTGGSVSLTLTDDNNFCTPVRCYSGKITGLGARGKSVSTFLAVSWEFLSIFRAIGSDEVFIGINDAERRSGISFSRVPRGLPLRTLAKSMSFLSDVLEVSLKVISREFYNDIRGPSIATRGWNVDGSGVDECGYEWSSCALFRYK